MREVPGAEVKLARGGRGDFIVEVDGARIWDKRSAGRFPDDAAIVDELRRRGA